MNFGNATVRLHYSLTNFSTGNPESDKTDKTDSDKPGNPPDGNEVVASDEVEEVSSVSKTNSSTGWTVQETVNKTKIKPRPQKVSKLYCKPIL